MLCHGGRHCLEGEDMDEMGDFFSRVVGLGPGYCYHIDITIKSGTPASWSIEEKGKIEAAVPSPDVPAGRPQWVKLYRRISGLKSGRYHMTLNIHATGYLAWSMNEAPALEYAAPLRPEISKQTLAVGTN